MPIVQLTDEDTKCQLTELHSDWYISDDGKSITREFKTQGFKQALSLTHLCAALAEEKNHHPDIRFGWGYCIISFSTHSQNSLSLLDFQCAQIFDELSSRLFENI